MKVILSYDLQKKMILKDLLTAFDLLPQQKVR